MAKAWLSCISDFEAAVAKLARLKLLFHGELPKKVWGYDPGKLVISTRGTALSGHALAQILRDHHGMEIEMAASDYIVAMTAPADTSAGLLQFARALCEIDAQLDRVQPVKAPVLPHLKTVYAPWQMADFPDITVMPACAEGCVAAEYVWAYPPGIPLVVPGELLDGALIRALNEVQAHGTELHSTSGGLPKTLRVLEDDHA